MYISLRKTGENGKQYYYTIHDRQPGLFHPYTLITIWGAKPDGGRRKIYGFETREEKDRALRGLIRKRIETGYTILYSYARSRVYRRVFQSFGQRKSTGSSSRAESG